MKKRRTKKALIIAGVIILVLAALIAASFIPTLWLKESGMSEIKGDWVTVYYQTEKNAAEDVFAAAESKAQQLAEKLGFTEKQEINIYIYDSQFTFQTKKYGIIGATLGLDWYIGDNRGTNVLLTSPVHPGKAHGYEECRDAALHEMVHAYNYILNPKMPLWLNEGVALYLSNGNPPGDLYNIMRLPTLEEIRTSNPIEFSNIGGYDFAYTYVEYIDKTYGWESVLRVLRTGSMEDTLQRSEQEIYSEWAEYLENNYSQ